MADFNFHAVYADQSLSHAFGEIYRSMLPSRTAESHLQMLSAIFLILIYRLTNQYFSSIKKTINPIFMMLKKINNRLVTS